MVRGETEAFEVEDSIAIAEMGIAGAWILIDREHAMPREDWSPSKYRVVGPRGDEP